MKLVGMDKIASPQDLQAEIRGIMAFIHASEKPDRQVLASKLRELAHRVAAAPKPARQKALDTMAKVDGLLDDAEKWISEYKAVRSKAVRENTLDDGMIGADKFLAYWKTLHPLSEEMRDLGYDELEDLYLDDNYNAATSAAFNNMYGKFKKIEEPVASATNDLVHIKDADRDKAKGTAGALAYHLKNLDLWAKKFDTWLKDARKEAKRTTSLAKKVRK
jgi:hypothetical protein